MEKINIEEYMQDILKAVEKVVEEEDEQAIEDLTSYIYVSKDIIRYYKTSGHESPIIDEAYSKINEAEEKALSITQFKYKSGPKLPINEVLNTFVESLSIFSKGY